jgi:DNA-binding NarL/FixJ family response regulator
VGEANDGQKAISEARRPRPDVVLMDTRMPVLGRNRSDTKHRHESAQCARSHPHDLRLGQAPPTLEELTPREQEVFDLLSRGLSNPEICQQLVISEATTKTHVARILQKLDLRDRVQAVIYAYETGLVTPGSPP